LAKATNLFSACQSLPLNLISSESCVDTMMKCDWRVAKVGYDMM
jgi:hypothetical protein